MKEYWVLAAGATMDMMIMPRLTILMLLKVCMCCAMLLCYVVVWCGANIVNTRVQFLLSDVTTLYLPVPVLKSYMSEIHAR